MSFDPRQYKFVVEMQRSEGTQTTSFSEASIQTLFWARQHCPHIDIAAGSIAGTGILIDHSLWAFDEPEPVGAHEPHLFTIKLNFLGRRFTDHLVNKSGSCKLTQNTLRAFVVGSSAQFRILVDGVDSLPLQLELNHRLVQICS